MVKLDKKGRPVESKEDKRRRIAANLKAKEAIKTTALPVVGIIFLVIVVVLFLGYNFSSPAQYAGAPPPKGDNPN